MCEGGELQCRLEAGHAEVHDWESWDEMLARTSANEQDVIDHEEGLPKMPQVHSVGGREVSE